MIAQGIKSPHRSVRNAALYAIGQFSEYLMPEIGEYAGEVLPVLFHFVDAAMAELNAKVGQMEYGPGIRIIPCHAYTDQRVKSGM